MSPSLTTWIKKVVFRLGAGGAALSMMEIPPDWNYQQYLQAYGQIGWLFAANSLISQAVADVKWHLYEKDGAQLGDEVDSHPLIDMWAYVNPFQTKYQFLQLTQMYLGLVGEAFWVLNFNRVGVPAEMWIAPPQNMFIVPDPVTYISHYEFRRGAGRIRLEVPEVIHIMNPNPYNPYRGLGAAQAISVDLDSERNASRYQNRLFYNDAMPGLIIEYPDIPEDSERQKIRAEWNEIHQGWRNARKTGFLWGGAKANTLALTNRDMEFWRLRKVNREVILGAYGIPATMLGIEGVGSRARVEGDDLVFSKNVLKPALTRIKEAINEQLVPLFDEGWLFDFEDPVPENREASVMEVKELYPIGVITREEARVMLGYDAEPQAGETFAEPPAPAMPRIMKQPDILSIKTFTDEQKETRWKLYAKQTEDAEEEFKRVFKGLWFDQMDEVAKNFEQLGNIDAAFPDSVDSWEESFNKIITQIFADAFEMATGGGELSTAHKQAPEDVLASEALEWIATRSLSLAKMVNNTTPEELRAALKAGYEAGESIPQLTKRIKGYYRDGYERRAKMVARTEVIAANNEGALQGYEKEGITKAEFYPAADACEECEGYSGQVVPINESHGTIPVHPNCRCVWLPVVD